MNRLRITLLLSTLMFPGLAFSTSPNENSSDVDVSGPKATVADKQPESKKRPELTVADKQSGSSKVDQGSSDTSSKDPSENDNAGNKSLFGSAAAFAYWPVGLAVGTIDCFADNTRIAWTIGKLAALKCWKDRCVGKWLTNHNQGLSRTVVVALIGGATYYYWKKCQECKQKQDVTSRTVGFSDDPEFDNFLEVQEG